MMRKVLVLLAVLAFCLSGLPVFAEEAYEAGETSATDRGLPG
jgi:hypothetical protein